MAKERKKNPAAVQLGRLGGKARAKRLTAEELSEIGKNAQKAWVESMTPEERKEFARRAGVASGKARARKAKKP